MKKWNEWRNNYHSTWFASKYYLRKHVSTLVETWRKERGANTTIPLVVIIAVDNYLVNIINNRLKNWIKVRKISYILSIPLEQPSHREKQLSEKPVRMCLCPPFFKKIVSLNICTFLFALFNVILLNFYLIIYYNLTSFKIFLSHYIHFTRTCVHTSYLYKFL